MWKGSDVRKFRRFCHICQIHVPLEETSKIQPTTSFWTHWSVDKFSVHGIKYPPSINNNVNFNSFPSTVLIGSWSLSTFDWTEWDNGTMIWQWGSCTKTPLSSNTINWFGLIKSKLIGSDWAPYLTQIKLAKPSDSAGAPWLWYGEVAWGSGAGLDWSVRRKSSLSSSHNH